MTLSRLKFKTQIFKLSECLRKLVKKLFSGTVNIETRQLFIQKLRFLFLKDSGAYCCKFENPTEKALQTSTVS